MGHAIVALLTKGPYDPILAERYDLLGIPLGFELTLFPIDHYYAACWQKLEGTEGYLPGRPPSELLVPTEKVLLHLVQKITGQPQPDYALLATDYFGGIGTQWAAVYKGETLAEPTITRISPALRYLGVTAAPGQDEFDTVGLDRIRTPPEYLDKYTDLADELQV